MDLKELLGALYTAEVAAAIGDKKFILDDGKFIPKHRFDEVNAEKKSLEAQVTKSETDMAALKDKAKGNEALTAQIEKLQADGVTAKTEYEKTLAQNKKSIAVEKALFAAGAVDDVARELIIGKIDMSKVELDDKGNVKDFDATVKPFKENKVTAALFAKTRIEGEEPGEGETGKPGVKNPFKKGENFNLTEQIKIQRENPALAAKLRAQA
jgi:hypothetical protein